MEYKRKAFVVNLFGGPGAGKTILMADLFSAVKRRGMNAEMAPEYAKDMVWQESFKVLENQQYIYGKQRRRMYRLSNTTDIIITDSPLLNSLAYAVGEDEDFHNLVFKEHSAYRSVNYFVTRTHPYQQEGRVQDEEGAKAKDRVILGLLEKYSVKHTVCSTDLNDLPTLVTHLMYNYNDI